MLDSGAPVHNTKTDWRPGAAALSFHPMKTMASRVKVALLVLAAATVAAAGTVDGERYYLSGRGKDDAVPWRFLCTTGALSGFWTNIPVPSNWELHGFGHLSYKKDATNAWTERGLYERDFAVPADWSGRRVFLVFEGAMTDASAKLNGQSVGPTHQGAFYRFQYEVTPLVKFGRTNKLEVTVAKHSANDSVNRAERLADYWVFGGIFRPVYLKPCRRNSSNGWPLMPGTTVLSGWTCISTVPGRRIPSKLKSSRWTGKPAGGSFGMPVAVGSGDLKAELRTKMAAPRPWTAETPSLYSVEVRLKRGREVIHRFRQRFGFRTMEVRDGDGLYVNGHKVILKGVNRHSFWPDSGRCLSEAVHRLDIETIKAMNANAVRMSHYPPDKEFLDLCDELGLYVLDELGGWHNHYDGEVGRKLVGEMVARDVNHPCILFWDNGNEGGWNTDA